MIPIKRRHSLKLHNFFRSSCHFVFLNEEGRSVVAIRVILVNHAIVLKLAHGHRLRLDLLIQANVGLCHQ
jgi:hypothetical protein